MNAFEADLVIHHSTAFSGRRKICEHFSQGMSNWGAEMRGPFLSWSSWAAREREQVAATAGCSLPGDIGPYLALEVHEGPPRTT